MANMVAVLGSWRRQATLVVTAVLCCAAQGAPAERTRKVEASASERKPVARQGSRPRVVLVFGDSLSAGYGLRVSESWPSLLQARLGEHFKVVNASVSGETTASGLTRLPAALKEHAPALLVLELGGNDGLRGLPLSLAEKNLGAMIELAQAAGAKVLLLSLQLPPNLGESYTGKFQAMFESLAKTFHLPAPPFLLEGIAEKRELFQADQIHPVASAQPRLVENIYPALLELARR